MNLFHLKLKRLFDILFSGVLIVVLIPFWIGISLAIKRDSKGPVIFKQERRTKDGKIFQMMKFRTMVVNAEKTGSGLFSYKDDPRITKTGKKLRNSSLDELPQLMNVFMGDMSLVGPRPCVAYELGDFDTLNGRYKKRFEMKAGITGLAQVKGRNQINWDEKVQYDNQYVDRFKKIGILADIPILVESVWKVFWKTGIYENKTDEAMDEAEAARIEEEKIIQMAHLPD
ncbi:MAG: sugar transferase [Lachnospiraceae bacterium]|nr:sugar transferase [Lachnospiraceae bacterium]